jgi:hypothetical protein
LKLTGCVRKDFPEHKGRSLLYKITYSCLVIT